MIKFGTGGFRAVMNEEFTKENVQKVAQSLARIIKAEKSTNPVVIGFDRRFMSDMFARWFAEVLAGNGITALLYDRPVPTPTVMFTVKDMGLDYGITITASHNPYQYNGIKITKAGGIDANVEFTNQIEKLANTNLRIKSLDYKQATESSLIKTIDNVKDYIKAISKFISKDIKNNKLKVLFNAMNGVTVESANIIAKAYNISKFTILNDEVDPYFNHKLPSPSEDTLEDFKKAVVKGHYSIGLAPDGDGDRLGVVDELGNFHNNNTIMAIIYYYLIKYRGMQGDIVKTMSTSIILDNLAETFGFKCHEVPIGFKWVAPKMLETDALLGGESSGGLTMRNWTPCKDSMFSISLILDAMATIKKPFSQIVTEVKEACNYISTYIEYNVTINDRKKFTKILNKKIPNFAYKPKEINRTDGVKYVFEGDSWVVIRFSGTENLLRIYVEFPTEIECERNIRAINNFISTYDGKKKK